jgi:hypothetical protein
MREESWTILRLQAGKHASQSAHEFALGISLAIAGQAAGSPAQPLSPVQLGNTLGIVAHLEAVEDTANGIDDPDGVAGATPIQSPVIGHISNPPGSDRLARAGRSCGSLIDRRSGRLPTARHPVVPCEPPGARRAAGLTRAVRRQANLAVTTGARAGKYYAATRLRICPPDGAPMSEAEVLARAAQLYEIGHLREAGQLYRLLLAYNRNHSEALLRLGLIAHELGERAAAVDLLRRAAASRPDRPGAGVVARLGAGGLSGGVRWPVATRPISSSNSRLRAFGASLSES